MKSTIKVTKRPTNDGLTYSISGLTYNQLFRIKNAMFREANEMKDIANQYAECPPMQRDFESFAQDALAVFNTLVNYC